MTPKPEYGPRELDAKIATRVMGWERRQYWCCGEPAMGIIGPEGVRYVNDFPEYSTDIAAAFAVVEAMRAKGWLVALADCGVDTPDWIASMIHTYSGRTVAARDVATAPLAICLASLSALDSLTTETEKSNG